MFEEPIPNKAIRDHVVSSEEVPYERDCRMMCYLGPNCVSTNVRPSNGRKYKCELNNAIAEENQLILLKERDSYYLGYFDDIGILEHAWNHPLLR